MNGDNASLFAAYAADRTDANRNRIVVAYLDLANQITAKFKSRVESADMDDLRSAAYMGLIEAVERYDPSRGVPFEGFAGRRVCGAMYDACRRADILSRSSRQHIKQYDEAAMQFRQAHGFPPTHEEVEAALGIRPGQWRKDFMAGQVTLTLTSNYEWAGEEDKFERVAADQPGPLAIAEARDGFEHLLSTDTLWPEERAVLRLQYQADRTLKQIAVTFDCSESKISYLAKDAREKIAAKLVA